MRTQARLTSGEPYADLVTKLDLPQLVHLYLQGIDGSDGGVVLRRRSRDATELHRRGLRLVRVVHLRDGRSLPHLRWLRIAGARTTPHARLP